MFAPELPFGTTPRINHCNSGDTNHCILLLQLRGGRCCDRHTLQSIFPSAVPRQMELTLLFYDCSPSPVFGGTKYLEFGWFVPQNETTYV